MSDIKGRKGGKTGQLGVLRSINTIQHSHIHIIQKGCIPVRYGIQRNQKIGSETERGGHSSTTVNSAN